MHWLIWVLIGFVLSGIPVTFILSWIIYATLLRRKKSDKWGRGPSMPTDEEYMRLYAQAEEWRKEHLSAKKDVETVNDKLRLAGEYFDFGADRAVIIIPGRMESCIYSCHYAEPYRAAGWNVLTVDGRAHGLSEGHVSSVGQKEYRDILAWARFLHDECNIKDIVLHGICIGSSTAIFAATDSACPDYIRGIVSDGVYQRFYDSFRNHMTEANRPLFPFLYQSMLYVRLASGVDVVHDGPMYRIDRLTKPVLFLHSREDTFSTPDKAQELFEKCASEQKTMHWFEHGNHSRLRVLNREEYDGAVLEYISGIAD